MKLVLEEGKSVAEVARDLDLTETAFRWGILQDSTQGVRPEVTRIEQ